MLLTKTASSAALELRAESGDTDTSAATLHLPSAEQEDKSQENKIKVAKKKISICEGANITHQEEPISSSSRTSSSGSSDTSSFQLQTSAELLSLSALTIKMPEASLPEITFKSSETGITYRLEYVIGTSIKDHIRLLKRNGMLDIRVARDESGEELKNKDGSSYNYGSPVTCVPPVPEYILTGMGLTAINQETIITEELATRLNSFQCVLWFRFDKQTKLLRPYEIPNPGWLKEENKVRELGIAKFLKSTKHPDTSMTTTQVLHHGYEFRKGKIIPLHHQKNPR